MIDDNKYMSEALLLAKIAYDNGDVPVGAVIVDKKTNLIIGKGYNKREIDKSAIAHAEIIAINEACEYKKSWRLSDCVMYVTLEPCPMCSGAIINSRISRVVYGAHDAKAGCCSSVINIFEFPFNSKPVLNGGVMEKECSKILSDFFTELRNNK